MASKQQLSTIFKVFLHLFLDRQIFQKELYVNNYGNCCRQIIYKNASLKLANLDRSHQSFTLVGFTKHSTSIS